MQTTSHLTEPPSSPEAVLVLNIRNVKVGWPNGLDVTPPTGTAVKTFGLRECSTDYTGCTSVFSNYANSPAGTEKIRGQDVPYSAFQQLGITPNSEGNTTFGTAKNRLVMITTNSTADTVYVYDPSYSATAFAYPKLLPSSSDGTTLTFSTFQPIVWTLTARTSEQTNLALLKVIASKWVDVGCSPRLGVGWWTRTRGV